MENDPFNSSSNVKMDSSSHRETCSNNRNRFTSYIIWPPEASAFKRKKNDDSRHWYSLNVGTHRCKLVPVASGLRRYQIVCLPHQERQVNSLCLTSTRYLQDRSKAKFQNHYNKTLQTVTPLTK